ncbi:MAG: DivIVA domain-containing protein [Erysipelotrichaceae bacterium]
MDNKFRLSVEEVLEKQFNIDFKGYSSVEVDEFLDMIIEDYQHYDATIKDLGNHLQSYEREVATLKMKIVELEGKNSMQNNQNATVNNLDIIKRLSRLENEVFRNKQNNQ